MSTVRNIEEVLVAQAASDGAGVKLKRVFGGQNLARFDPFLMLDEFGSEEAADYIGGFPSHPHRGFETVTYMLEGYMEHRDHMDNVGKLGPGDVQWMKAGSGVIHSEMPQQEEGRMRGFQLWVNLPAAEKMTPASYQDIAADKIPVYAVGDIKVRAIAGKLSLNGTQVAGYVNDLTTEPGYLDVEFGAADTAGIAIPDGHNALVYVYEGSARIGEDDYVLAAGKLARLNHDGELRLQAEAGTRLLVISGKPLGEPIVHHGPFVMNSVEEIQTAVRDYSEGRLVS
ncbi:MAG: pirin family protein [Pseudohongiellaceae bacterium]|jgi:redox-sensitive bicupin YhaK (pirin superfamily)